MYAPCPKCRQSAAEKVSFTWWGGLIGPRILSHVKCRACGTGYNGKTGKDNTTGIIIYAIVVAGICFFLLFLVFFALAVLTFFANR